MALTVSVESRRAIMSCWPHGVRSMSIRAGLVQPAKIVLLAADAAETNEIARRTGLRSRR
jgi:hypothetical protein